MPTTQSTPSLVGFPEVSFSASLFAGLTEAENLSIDSGFAVVSNPHASGGRYLQATSATSRAGGVFEGPVGLYDINLSYFDETDGVSHMEVLINGAVVAAFDWDATGGDAIVTKASAAVTSIAGLVLAPGDVIELRGMADGGEPLRTDAIEILASATPAVGESFVIEAEDLQILSGFSIASNGAASGDQTLQHLGGGTARASYTVQQAGSFDLAIGYFDETDGASWMQVLVNGTVVADWAWDATGGGAIASTASKATEVIEGLALGVGDVIELRGQGDGGEPLRVDYLEFTAVADGPDGPWPPATRDLWYRRDGEIFVALNDGTGGFTEFATGVPSGAWAVDMDGDGDLDFFSAAVTDGPDFDLLALPDDFAFELTTTIYENLGDGTFAAGVSTSEPMSLRIDDFYGYDDLSLGEFLEFGEPGDLDGDGEIDFAAVSVTGNLLVVFENDGDDSFTLQQQPMPSAIFLLAYYSNALLLADMNGDAAMDMLLSSSAELSSTVVLMNDGTNMFEAVGFMSQSDDGNALEQVVDLDGDGDNDVMYLAVSDGGGIYSYLNDGTGAEQPGPSPTFNETESPGYFVVGNFDSEPGLEVVDASIGSGGFDPGLRVFDITDDGDGLEMNIVSYDPSIVGAVQEVGDFDGDGDLDIILTTRAQSSEVLLLLNDGAAHFTAVETELPDIENRFSFQSAPVFAGELGDLPIA